MATRQEEKETRREARIEAEEALRTLHVPEPILVEVSLQFSNGGRVDILDFGKVRSDYNVSFSRRWVIPPDWSDEQAKEFHHEQFAKLRGEVEPLAQKEFDERWDQSYLSEG